MATKTGEIDWSQGNARQKLRRKEYLLDVDKSESDYEYSKTQLANQQAENVKINDSNMESRGILQSGEAAKKTSDMQGKYDAAVLNAQTQRTYDKTAADAKFNRDWMDLQDNSKNLPDNTAPDNKISIPTAPITKPPSEVRRPTPKPGKGYAPPGGRPGDMPSEVRRPKPRPGKGHAPPGGRIGDMPSEARKPIKPGKEKGHAPPGGRIGDTPSESRKPTAPATPAFPGRRPGDMPSEARRPTPAPPTAPSGRRPGDMPSEARRPTPPSIPAPSGRRPGDTPSEARRPTKPPYQTVNGPSPAKDPKNWTAEQHAGLRKAGDFFSGRSGPSATADKQESRGSKRVTETLQAIAAGTTSQYTKPTVPSIPVPSAPSGKKPKDIPSETRKPTAQKPTAPPYLSPAQQLAIKKANSATKGRK